MIKHGYCPATGPTPTYQTWQQMIDRCTNSKRANYLRYGARGIKVCEAWLNSFEAFVADMGDRPDGTTLDRKDNDGHYEPGNCRWATRKEQARNTSRTVLVTMRGETKCLSDWCDDLGLPYTVIKARVGGYGWDPVRALTVPIVSVKDRTHCPQGHHYNTENTRFEGKRKVSRKCRICDRERHMAKRIKAAMGAP